MTPSWFSVHPTPIGEALIVLTDAGLATLQILDGAPGAAVAAVGLRLGSVPQHDPAGTARVADQLDEYFAGERRTFDIALDERLVRGFTAQVLRAITQIPYGQTASYGEVAILAGVPRAARAVGTACAQTPWSIVVPAHRVIRADGSIGEYGGHPDRKRFLLELEDRVAGGHDTAPARAPQTVGTGEPARAPQTVGAGE